MVTPQALHGRPSGAGSTHFSAICGNVGRNAGRPWASPSPPARAMPSHSSHCRRPSPPAMARGTSASGKRRRSCFVQRSNTSSESATITPYSASRRMLHTRSGSSQSRQGTAIPRGRPSKNHRAASLVCPGTSHAGKCGCASSARRFPSLAK